MRTLLMVSLILVSHVLLAQRYDPEIKDKPRFATEVNDFGDFLTWGQESKLEDELYAYRKRTGNAIVIITLKTLPLSIKETSVQYFNKWGIGGWLEDNGILLLVSRNPRRVRITTGKGVDDILTDNDCQRIIDETIVPAFKVRDFYTGLRSGVNDIEAILGDKEQRAVHTPAPVYVAPKAPTPPPQQIISYGPENVDDSESNDNTARLLIWSLIGFGVLIWLYIKYQNRKEPDAETFSSDGYSGPESEKANDKHPLLQLLIGIGLVLFWIIKYSVLLPIVLCGLLFKMFGGGGSYGGGSTSGGGASGSW